MENVNQKRLFVAACLALLVTAITFAIRAKIEGVFTVDYGLSKEEVGRAFAPAFWGFAVAMFAGGYFIDIVKTKTIVWAAYCVAADGQRLYFAVHGQCTDWLGQW